MVVDQKVKNTNRIDGAVNSTPPCPAVDGGDEGRPSGRLPRWTRKEILVLIQGKTDAENRFRSGPAFGSTEPKWVSVSSYCKDHGVNRGAVQCRKRWSNMVGDYKKIKEWENEIRDETESFWVMRNDLRRERKLPGYFDREVYDILDAASPAAAAAAAVEKQYQPLLLQVYTGKGNGQGTTNDKHPASNPEAGSTSQEGRRKRTRFATDDGEEETLQSQLIDVMERNGKMVQDQLESRNMNFELDMQQQKDTASNIVNVLDKLANALGRIADKL
ncbi:unnamed protein product [Lupinus luteus]|uniref:Myb-like domain-containing protein n=1 Tax=Lupinus luteus TaxID=3873 RepID=A0AAV1WH10_LUPLU